MSFDPSKLRFKIRHFLLQQSQLYHRSVGQNRETMPPISAMAQELSKTLNMPRRRIQKYLTEDLPPKEISISVTDLYEFAQLQQQSLSEFVAYLNEEVHSNQLSEAQEKLIVFFSQLHEGHRRSLKSTLLSLADPAKSERLVDLVINLYSLSNHNLTVIEEVVRAFVNRDQGNTHG